MAAVLRLAPVIHPLWVWRKLCLTHAVVMATEGDKKVDGWPPRLLHLQNDSQSMVLWVHTHSTTVNKRDSLYTHKHEQGVCMCVCVCVRGWVHVCGNSKAFILIKHEETGEVCSISTSTTHETHSWPSRYTHTHSEHVLFAYVQKAYYTQ